MYATVYNAVYTIYNKAFIRSVTNTLSSTLQNKAAKTSNLWSRPIRSTVGFVKVFFFSSSVQNRKTLLNERCEAF